MTLIASVRRHAAPPAVDPHRKVYRRLLWLAPLGTFVTVVLFFFYLDKAIAGVAGLIALTRLARNPGASLRWLIVFLPFSLLTLSFLFKIGVPAQLVRPLSFWKEALVAAVVVAGILRARQSGVKADLLDGFCLAYVALATAYMAVPDVFVDGPGAGFPFGTRLNGFRTDAIYVLIFLGARHARIPAAEVRRAARAFMGMAGIIAGIGVFEFFAASTWNNFVINTLGLPSYKYFVLNVTAAADPTFYNIRVYTVVAGREVLRIGSVLLGFQPLAFVLIVAVALLAEFQLRAGTGKRGWIAVALPLAGVAILLTQTRSALLALGAVFALVVLRQPGRQLVARVRMTLVVGALALLAVPVIFSIGLSDRLSGKDDNSSNTAHANSTRAGLEVLADVPLGNGLATAAGAGQRTGQLAQVSENQLLQIGTQLGVAGLLLWAGAYVSVIRATGTALQRYLARVAVGARAPDHPAAAVVAGTRVAFIALIPAMLYLQVFIFFPVSWALWGLAGAALGSLEHEAGDDPRDAAIAVAPRAYA